MIPPRQPSIMSTANSTREYPDEFTRLVLSEGGGDIVDEEERHEQFISMHGRGNTLEHLANGIMLCKDMGARYWCVGSNELIHAAVEKYYPGYTDIKPVFRQETIPAHLNAIADEMLDIFQANDSTGEGVVFLFQVDAGAYEYSLSLINTFKLGELGLSSANLEHELASIMPHPVEEPPYVYNEPEFLYAPDGVLQAGTYDNGVHVEFDDDGEPMIYLRSDHIPRETGSAALTLNTELYALKAQRRRIENHTSLAMAAHPRLGDGSSLSEMSDVLAEIAKFL